MQLKAGPLALKIAGIYIGVAAAWIIVSDPLLAFFVASPDDRSHDSLALGLIFALGTGIVLHQVLRYWMKRWEHELEQREQDEAARQSAGEKLRQSEELLRVDLQANAQKYRQLVENMVTGLMVCEVICDDKARPRDHKFVQGNAAFEKLTGLSLKDLVGKTSQNMPPCWPPEMTQRLYSVAMTGETFEYTRYNEAAGRHFEARAFSPRRGQFAQIFNDISERKRAEASVRASERQFRTVLETVSLVGIMLDRRGCLTLCNDYLLRLTGWKRDEVISQSWFDLFLPTGRREDVRGFSLAAIATGDVPAHFEGEIITRKGERRLVVWNNTVLRDEDGSVVGLASIGEDVTDRKRIEESHARLATAVDQAAETIVLIDVHGTIIYANPAFEKTSGYTRAEALGQNRHILKSGKHDDEFYRKMWDTLGRGETWQGHFVNRRKDGALYEEEATISPVRDASGTIINYAVIKRDVTQEVHLADQLRQSQKMEAIGQLAGGVAHEFNNILMTLMLKAEMLELNDTLPQKIREGLHQIRMDGQRAANLTRQLLLFSRRQVMQPRLMNSNELVLNSTRLLKRIVRENIEIHQRLHPAPLLINADPSMIEQVLMNLAVHASDAMPQGGMLIIETAERTLDQLGARLIPDVRPGRFICFKVTDTGKGISPDLLPQLFEPFATAKVPGEGSGLGLATVFGIVKQHQGWIEVDSQLGQGATFRVYLPASTEPIPATMVDQPESTKAASTPATKPTPAVPAIPPEPVPTAPTAGGETILLVEDEPSVRSMVSELLQYYGYTVLEAVNGVEALARWQENQETVALLFTDVIMPGGMSGVELARRLREEQPQLRVVFTSGYDPDVAGRELELREGENFVPKPCSSDQLMESIRRALAA
jgi:two-component system cell cycle sensor histidine kinase/response regulator CckA